MKLFLDDERGCPNGWTLASTPWDMLSLIDKHWDVLEGLSFDHDLGSGCQTGYDVVVELEKKIKIEGKVLPESLTFLNVHSANPVGAKRIAQCLKGIAGEIRVTRWPAHELNGM